MAEGWYRREPANVLGARHPYGQAPHVCPLLRRVPDLALANPGRVRDLPLRVPRQQDVYINEVSRNLRALWQLNLPLPLNPFYDLADNF